MRNPLLPAVFLAVALGTEPSASAQVRIDTSSPDAVVASLAELHERWPLIQFTEFLRAALIAQLPEEVGNPASWQEGQNRWEFLEDAMALWAGLSIYQPLLHEGDPFALDLDQAGPWLQQSLARVLQEQTMDEVVSLGRDREHSVLIRLRERYEGWSRDLERVIEDAEIAALHPAPSIQDRRNFETLQGRIADFSTTIERLDRRREEIEGMGPFVPSAVGCSLEQGIDRSTEQAMMAELEVLAATCPQKRLIKFLRAAAILSEVPAALTEPGARMEGAALRRAEDILSLASRTVGGFAALVRRDPFVRGLDSIPARLKKMLDAVLAGRSVADVASDGSSVERALLVTLRDDLSERLRSEFEEQRDETAAQGTPAPDRPSAEVRWLRGYIERVARRLAMLEAEAPAPHPPGAD